MNRGHRFKDVIVLLGLSVFVAWFWRSGTEGPTTNAQAVDLLDEELRAQQAGFWSVQGSGLAPSPHARELASQISRGAGPYGLALKALAEGRFADARRYANGVGNQDVGAERVALLRGQIEDYAGQYAQAADWYQNALQDGKKDAVVLSRVGFAMYAMNRYLDAEQFCTQVQDLWGKDGREDRVLSAARENSLGVIALAQGKYLEAEESLMCILNRAGMPRRSRCTYGGWRSEGRPWDQRI